MTMTTPVSSSDAAGSKESGEPRVKWLPLEADPVLLAQYVNSLGGPISCAVEEEEATEKKHEAPEAVLSFEDVLSLEDWATGMARNPTVAVLLVYPVPRDPAEKEQQQQHKQTKTDAEGIWFTKQTVRNACGTVALLHCIANLPRNRFPLQPDGILDTFLKETASLSPEERARALEKSGAFAAAHRAFERKGQSAVPSAEDADVDTHYITFIYDEKSTEVVELDGTKSGPVFYKSPLSAETGENQQQHLLKSVAAIIRDEFISKSKGDLRFQLIAVGDAKAGRQMRQQQK